MMKYTLLLLLIILGVSCNTQSVEKSPAPQPYEYITGKHTGEKVPLSPDPLIDLRWENPQADDELQIYTLKPVVIQTDAPESFENLMSLKKNQSNVVVKGTGSIMMDFGQENAAWLEFDSDDLSGDVSMSISEYNEPAILNEGAQNRIKTLTPIKYGNTYRLELNDELFEGVRFGWIHVNTFEKQWHIDNVRLVCQIKPTNYRGSFSCSDPLLTQIWYTGAYGVKLNLLKDYFGAILMDRSDRFSWTGDAYPSQAAALVAFANYDFIKKNIFHTSKQSNGIESYSLYWIQSLVDYFNYTGDTETVLHFIDNACNKLDHAYEIFGTNPSLSYYGWDERIGAGFLRFNGENDSDTEAQNAFKMLSIESWNDFATVLKSLGKNELSDKYKAYAIEKLNEIRKENEWTKKYGIHAASDAINTGLLSTEEKKSLFETSFTNRLNRLSFSPFNQFFIIQAMARLGKYDEALETIRDQWGEQINYGATSFFEVFRPSWNIDLGKNDPPPNGQCGYTSIAHPWGGGVVKWITEEILGIKPVAPGFKSIEIMPHPGRTLTDIRGEVPTPLGSVGVLLDISKGIYQVKIPGGITAAAGIPKMEKDINSIRLNGKYLWKDSKQVSSQFTLNETNEFITITTLTSGTYDFVIEYIGGTPEYEASEWKYPAKFVCQDSVSRGDWKSKYGKEGYVLFNYQDQNGDPIHIKNLKGKIVDISLNLNADSIWGTNLNDSRVLEPDNKLAFERNAGAIFTQDPRPCWQTMTIDVKLSDPEEHYFSLYFLDWDNQSRRTGIEVFDLETKNIIAPVRIVEGYSSGKYMTYSYNKSIRFRINHVRGPNAVISGIFFDKENTN